MRWNLNRKKRLKILKKKIRLIVIVKHVFALRKDDYEDMVNYDNATRNNMSELS